MVGTPPGQSKLRVPGDVLIQELQGEAVILNLATGCYFGLDQMGYSIWKTLVESPSISAAQESLLQEYDVSAEQLHRDVHELVAKLIEHQLLEVVD